MPEASARHEQQLLGFRFGHPGAHTWLAVLRIQALGLRDIEDGEAAQQRVHLPAQLRWIIVVLGEGVRHYADAAQLPEHDRRALLALADVGAEVQRLAEGQPAVDGVAVLLRHRATAT